MCVLQSWVIYRDLSLKKICVYMGFDDDEVSTAMANVLQNMISAITDLDRIRKERDTHEEKRKKQPNLRLRPFFHVFDRIGGCSHQVFWSMTLHLARFHFSDEEGMLFVDEVFPALIAMLNNHKVSKYGRDNSMELIIKFITKTDGVGWSIKLIEGPGSMSEICLTVI